MRRRISRYSCRSHPKGTVEYTRGRENGPAIMYPDGTLVWKVWVKGESVPHREEGPAVYVVDFSDSGPTVRYRLKGVQLTHEEFLQKTMSKI